MFLKVLFTLLISSTFFISCVSSKKRTMITQIDDTTENSSNGLSGGFNDADARFIVKKVVGQLNNSEIIKNKVTKDASRLKIQFRKFSNESDERVDLMMLKNGLTNKLIMSSKYFTILMSKNSIESLNGVAPIADFVFSAMFSLSKKKIGEHETKKVYTFLYKLTNPKDNKVFYKNKVLITKTIKRMPNGTIKVDVKE